MRKKDLSFEKETESQRDLKDNNMSLRYLEVFSTYMKTFWRIMWRLFHFTQDVTLRYIELHYILVYKTLILTIIMYKFTTINVMCKYLTNMKLEQYSI